MLRYLYVSGCDFHWINFFRHSVIYFIFIYLFIFSGHEMWRLYLWFLFVNHVSVTQQTHLNVSEDLLYKMKAVLFLNVFFPAFQWRFMNTRWYSRPLCLHQLSLLVWLLTRSSPNETSASSALGSALLIAHICPYIYHANVYTDV